MEVRTSRYRRSKGILLWVLLPPATWMAFEVTAKAASEARYLARAERTARSVGFAAAHWDAEEWSTRRAPSNSMDISATVRWTDRLSAMGSGSGEKVCVLANSLVKSRAARAAPMYTAANPSAKPCVTPVRGASPGRPNSASEPTKQWFRFIGGLTVARIPKVSQSPICSIPGES